MTYSLLDDSKDIFALDLGQTFNLKNLEEII